MNEIVVNITREPIITRNRNIRRRFFWFIIYLNVEQIVKARRHCDVRNFNSHEVATAKVKHKKKHVLNDNITQQVYLFLICF